MYICSISQLKTDELLKIFSYLSVKDRIRLERGVCVCACVRVCLCMSIYLSVNIVGKVM